MTNPTGGLQPSKPQLWAPWGGAAGAIVAVIALRFTGVGQYTAMVGAVLAVVSAGRLWRMVPVDRRVARHYSGDYSTLTVPPDAKATSCSPYRWVADSFLCIGDGTTGSPHGVFKMTLSGHSLSQVALLPDSELAALSATVSPDGAQLAVIARDRTAGVTSLFTASMAGNSQPVKVADLSFSNQYLSDTQLVAWL